MPRWHEMAQTLADNNIDPFASMSALLAAIGITNNQANAMFLYDYYDAELIEDDYRRISMLFEIVAVENAKKFQTLIDDYPFSEVRKRVRAPNLTKTINGGTNQHTETTRNQTETVTETPKNDYGQTREHSVNPYDNTGYKTEYKDAVTNTGSRDVETKYTGLPDESETQITANSRESETGTDTTTETVTGNARLTMAETMQDIADSATIWEIIETAIAKKIFVQVWR